MRTIRSGFFFSLAISALSSIGHARIIASNNNTVVLNALAANAPGALRAAVEATGRLNYGCTVTHIGSGVVITAGHCFAAPPTPTENQTCQGLEVQWGAFVETGPVSKCVRILAMQDNPAIGMDFALFVVDKPPRTFVSMDATTPLRVNQQLTVLSYPESVSTLVWSRHCAIGSPGVPVLSRYYIHHQCDTLPGSSGAGMLDATSIKLVAIHNGGNGAWNYGTILARIPVPLILRKNRIVLPTVQPLR